MSLKRPRENDDDEGRSSDSPEKAEPRRKRNCERPSNDTAIIYAYVRSTVAKYFGAIPIKALEEGLEPTLKQHFLAVKFALVRPPQGHPTPSTPSFLPPPAAHVWLDGAREARWEWRKVHAFQPHVYPPPFLSSPAQASEEYYLMHAIIRDPCPDSPDTQQGYRPVYVTIYVRDTSGHQQGDVAFQKRWTAKSIPVPGSDRFASPAELLCVPHPRRARLPTPHRRQLRFSRSGIPIE